MVDILVTIVAYALLILVYGITVRLSAPKIGKTKAKLMFGIGVVLLMETILVHLVFSYMLKVQILSW